MGGREGAWDGTAKGSADALHERHKESGVGWCRKPSTDVEGAPNIKLKPHHQRDLRGPRPPYFIVLRAIRATSTPMPAWFAPW